MQEEKLPPLRVLEHPVNLPYISEEQTSCYTEVRRDKGIDHKTDFKVKKDYMALKFNNKACYRKGGRLRAAT